MTGTSPLIQAAAVERMAATHAKLRAVQVSNTNHYTIALAEPAASIVADALVEHAEACGV